MVECEAEERKHPSIDLYAGIFNSKLYSSNRGDLHRHSHQNVHNRSRRFNVEEDVTPSVLSGFDGNAVNDSRFNNVSFDRIGDEKITSHPKHKNNPQSDLRSEMAVDMKKSDVVSEKDSFLSNLVTYNKLSPQGNIGTNQNPTRYQSVNTTHDLIAEHSLDSREESVVKERGNIPKPFCDNTIELNESGRSDPVFVRKSDVSGESNGAFGNSGHKSGEINGNSLALNVKKAQTLGETNGAFGNNGHKSGEVNGNSYANTTQTSGELMGNGRIRHQKSGEHDHTDIKGSFHGLSLKDSPNRGNPMLTSIRVGSGSLDSSSSHGGSSNGGSPTASESTTKDGRGSSFGNILVTKSSPGSRPMGNILGSGNQFRSGSGLGRKSSGEVIPGPKSMAEIVPGRKSGEILSHDHLRGSASHRMGTESVMMNSLPSTTSANMNKSSAEMLFNDHLRGSATHRMETNVNLSKGNLSNSGGFGGVNNGNLLVGSANGSVLTYGSGAKTSSGKQGESTNNCHAIDFSLLRRVQGNSDPEDLNNSGNEYYKRGLFTDALVFYERAVVLCPTNASYRSNRGAALSGLGRLAEAVCECEESIRLDPLCYGRAHQRVASLYIRLGLLESANRHLHVAGQNVDLVELQRLQNIEKHFSRCINARKLREWLNVIRESDAAVVAGADSASEFFGYKCEALLRLHKPEEADNVCSVAQRIDASLVNTGIKLADPFLHIIRAQIDMALGRFEEAVNAAEMAVKIDPTHAEAGALLRKSRFVSQARINGNEFFKFGRFFEALASYAEGLECDPNNAVLLCNRAACRMKLGQWEKAVEDCDSALRLQPNYMKARMRRASCSAKLERWEDARQDYEILRREIPGDIDVARGFFEVQVAIKKSRGEEIYKMKFGGDVEEICSDEQFREAVSSPGLSVVQFITRWSDRCQQLSPFIDDLCKRHPCTNFLRVDVEEHPYLTRIESVTFIPTFKLYKNGQKVKEILGPSEQTLEHAVKHYSL